MRSCTHKLFGLLLATAILLSAAVARGQESCMSHEEAVAWLDERYGEQVIGRGLADQGRVMFEIFTGPKGTWTLLVSTPEGPSCIIADGFDWQQLTPRPKDAVAATIERPAPPGDL